MKKAQVVQAYFLAKKTEMPSTLPQNGMSSKLASINSRFFGNNPIIEETENSTTTIGFGAAPTKSNGVSLKSVSFKTTSMNTSKSTTDEGDSEDEADAEPQFNGNPFMTEQERKTYLEEQFQESVKDYHKIVQRLENENILPF